MSVTKNIPFSFVSSTSRRRGVIYHVPPVVLYSFYGMGVIVCFHGERLKRDLSRSASALSLLCELFVSRRLLKREKSRPFRFHTNRFVAIICLADTNNQF